MKIKEIVSALERFAPLPLQDGFDNAGLQIGLTDAEATGALLCLDVTEAVLDEAIALGYNLVISHHPLIFKGYKSITGKDYVERCILKAIKNDIVIYSAHTNLDNAPEGVNFKIAEKIGLKNVRVLEAKENALLKLVTFVPVTRAEEVRTALASAGCGVSAIMIRAATMWKARGCSVLLKAPILIAEKSASCMWKRRRASKPFCRLTGKQKLSKRYLPHIRTKNLHLIYIRCRTPGNKPEQALSANWKLRKPSWSS